MTEKTDNILTYLRTFRILLPDKSCLNRFSEHFVAQLESSGNPQIENAAVSAVVVRSFEKRPQSLPVLQGVVLDTRYLDAIATVIADVLIGYRGELASLVIFTDLLDRAALKRRADIAESIYLAVTSGWRPLPNSLPAWNARIRTLLPRDIYRLVAAYILAHETSHLLWPTRHVSDSLRQESELFSKLTAEAATSRYEELMRTGREDIFNSSQRMLLAAIVGPRQAWWPQLVEEVGAEIFALKAMLSHGRKTGVSPPMVVRIFQLIQLISPMLNSVFRSHESFARYWYLSDSLDGSEVSLALGMARSSLRLKSLTFIGERKEDYAPTADTLFRDEFEWREYIVPAFGKASELGTTHWLDYERARTKRERALIVKVPSEGWATWERRVDLVGRYLRGLAYLGTIPKSVIAPDAG
jgi:hypothetical protein